MKIRGQDRRGLKGRERWWGSWAGGSQPPPHQLGGLRERFKLSQRGPGRSPGRPSGFLHFIDARWLFLASHYIAKKFSSQHFGGVEPVNSSPLNTALAARLQFSCLTADAVSAEPRIRLVAAAN